MLPLLGEVMTDLAKSQKNRFMERLLVGEPLTTIERDEFVRYYFEERQDQHRKRPFLDNTTEQNKKFWYAFTDEFSKYIILRFRLSGSEGTRSALMPDQDGHFNLEASRNLYNLAYRITNDFEQERIKQLIEADQEAAEAAGNHALLKKIARDSELLLAGKLKLIIVDGVERYISEEEIRAAAASNNPAIREMKVTPLLAVGLGKMKDPAAAQSALESGGKISAGNVQGMLTAEERPEEAEQAKFYDLQNDFQYSSAAGLERKNEDLVTALADNGLQITPDTFNNPRKQWNLDENGFLKGEVTDREGQKMRVKINTALGKADPDKFEFTLLDADGRPMKMPDGMILSFKCSEEDLMGFKDNNAAQMLQRTRPNKAPEKQGAGKPAKKGERPAIPITGYHLRLVRPGLEGELPNMAMEAELPAPGINLPAGAKAREQQPAWTSAGEGMKPAISTTASRPLARKFKKPTIGPRPLPPSSIMRAKQTVLAQRTQMAGARIPPTFTRPAGTQQITAGSKKKKKPWGVIAAISANGILLGGTIVGAGAVATTNYSDQNAMLLNMLAAVSDTIARVFTQMAEQFILHPPHDLVCASFKIALANFVGGAFFT